MTEHEIERMVIRLLGDATLFHRMLNEVERQLTAWGYKIDKICNEAQLRFAVMAEKIGASLTKVGTKMRALGRWMTLNLTAPLLGLGYLATSEFSKFDKAMQESVSIMKVTEEQEKRLRDAALELSQHSNKAPELLAKAYYFLASAGYDVEQSIKALPQIVKFATAGAFDLAEATTFAADAQVALGLRSADAQENLENLVRITDTLTRADQLANASIRQFSIALTSTAGASLKTFHKDVEEGVAVLAAMAEQGIKAELAGHSLSRVILLLSKSALDNAKAHEKFGFSVFDASGKMRHFADIVENLEEILGPMADEARAATLDILGFEARIQHAILPLIGSSKAIREYEKQLRSAGGATQEVAEKQMKAFANQMTRFWNVVKAVGIEIGEILAPWIGKLTQAVEKGLTWWKALSPVMKKVTVVVGLLVAAIGPLLIFVGLTSIALGGLFSAMAVLAPVIFAVGGAIAAAFSPAGAIIAALIALIVNYAGGFKKLFEGIKETAVTIWNKVSSAAIAAFEFIRPVLIQFWNLATTVFKGVWEVATFAFEWISIHLVGVWSDFKEAFMSVWPSLKSVAGTTIKFIRDWLLETLLFAEYAFLNMGLVGSLVFIQIQLAVVKLGNEIHYLFTAVIPSLLDWFGQNWKAVFFDAINYATVVFLNFNENIKNALIELWDFIASGGQNKFEMMWKPLEEGFVKTMQALPKIPDREMGALEKELAGEVETLTGIVAEGYGAFRDKRMKELFPKPIVEGVEKGVEEAGKASEKVKQVGAGIGTQIGAEIGDKMKKAISFDAALFNSVEAMRRIAEFQEGKPVVAGTGGRKDQAKTLESINEGVEEMVELMKQQLSKPSLSFDAAGFA